MPCLLIVLALATPRLALVLAWIFTSWFRAAFDSVLWPILGFIFLPATALWYAVVQHWFGGEWTFWPIAGLVVALLMDLSPAEGRRRRA